MLSPHCGFYDGKHHTAEPANHHESGTVAEHLNIKCHRAALLISLRYLAFR